MAEKEYIEREALLSKTYDIKACGKTYRVVMYDDVILAPIADVAPVRHGHWIVTDTGCGEISKCSCCGNTTTAWNRKYCDECGAKMEGWVDE
ncbi:MAG: hypothetical protein ACI4KR_02205 [Ruminiclostridium sp.]